MAGVRKKITENQIDIEKYGCLRGANGEQTNIYLQEGKRVYHPNPETKIKIMEVANMVAEGKTRTDCYDFLKEKYNLTPRQSRVYYGTAIRMLMPNDMEKWKKEVIAENVNRLQKIIEESMSEKSRNYRMAKDAIDSLNKMFGIGGNGNSVQIAKNSNGDELINISFE